MNHMKEDNSEIKVSFVTDIDNLKKVENSAELQSLIDSCRKNNKSLMNLDLSGVELKNMDFSGLQIENVVFNVYDASRSDYKEIFNVSFKGTELNRVAFAQCSFMRCNFDKFIPTEKELEKQNKTIGTYEEKSTVINEGDFFMTRWESCRFRRTEINKADFRYSEFNNCSMGGCRVNLGDFYMAAFRGTTDFTDSVFSRCSITNAIFENDLIRMKGIDKLVQECYKEYSKVIIGHPKWYKQNPCGDFSHKNDGEDEGNAVKSKAYIRQESSVMYAQLSGLYASKGFFKDSNLAYEKAKCNEAWAKYYEVVYEFMKLGAGIRKTFKRWFDRKGAETKDKCCHVSCSRIIRNIFSLINFFVSWVLGFGYKLTNVVLCIVLLVTGYTILFHLKNDEKIVWYDELASSLNNTVGPYQDFYSVVGLWLSSIQTTVGILLIGFAGFVLANRVRSNY